MGAPAFWSAAVLRRFRLVREQSMLWAATPGDWSSLESAAAAGALQNLAVVRDAACERPLRWARQRFGVRRCCAAFGWCASKACCGPRRLATGVALKAPQQRAHSK